MFDPQNPTHLFGIPNGVDFPKSLVNGLIKRMDGHPPHEIARVEVIINTRRMARRMGICLMRALPFCCPALEC